MNEKLSYLLICGAILSIWRILNIRFLFKFGNINLNNFDTFVEQNYLIKIFYFYLFLLEIRIYYSCLKLLKVNQYLQKFFKVF